MQTATPRQRMQYCRAFQDVTGNGEFGNVPLPDAQELHERYFDRVADRQSFAMYECPLEAA